MSYRRFYSILIAWLLLKALLSTVTILISVLVVVIKKDINEEKKQITVFINGVTSEAWTTIASCLTR